MESLNRTKVAAAALIIIAIIAFAFLPTSSHWWRKQSTAKVFVDGNRPSNYSIYRAQDGRILVDLRPDDTLYIVNPTSKQVGIPNDEFYRLPSYVFSKEIYPPLASMGKAEVDPQLIVKTDYVEFNSAIKGRVKVLW